LKWISLSLAAALTLTATAAFAQGVDEFGPYGGLQNQDYQSPQNVAVELRFGRYLPNVDSEFSNATPFKTTFGTDNRYLIGLEVDWQALRIPMFGTFGPGIGWGYTKASAPALLADRPGRAAEDTSLGVMPMYLVGVLRVDVFARHTPVPLVPYAKAGFGYALWWSDNGGNAARDDAGTLGRGTSYGYQFALGGMFLLDSLDKSAALEMDNATGINNSYFFMEWYYSNLNGFGGSRMQVGANTWMLGLAFEI
jgi:hypothetical protein